MPTREWLLNPINVPCGGMLRWLTADGYTQLQVFNSNVGEWEYMPTVTQAELDKAGVK